MVGGLQPRGAQLITRSALRRCNASLKGWRAKQGRRGERRLFEKEMTRMREERDFRGEGCGPVGSREDWFRKGGDMVGGAEATM